MKEKNYQLEVLRVISCINVILIHVCNLYSRSFGEITDGEYVFSVILNAMARTSVPIFFMISGATSLGSNYDFKKYVKKVVNMAVVGCGGAVIVEQRSFFQRKAGFAAFAQLQGDKTYRFLRTVAKQEKAFCFHSCSAGAGDEMGKVLRLVHHIKVAAVLQHTGCGTAQLLGGAA